MNLLNLLDWQIADLGTIRSDLKGKLSRYFVWSSLHEPCINEFVQLLNKTGNDHLTSDVIIHKICQKNDHVQSFSDRVLQMLIV